jgi:serine/threonine protein kinase
VIGFIELISTSNNFYCILEYANGGSLQTLLRLKQRFPEKVAREVIRQIVEGCNAMYDAKVMHRDLKLDNILIQFPDRDDFKQLSKEELLAIDLS